MLSPQILKRRGLMRIGKSGKKNQLQLRHTILGKQKTLFLEGWL
jgi:hypothetical protein